MRAIMNSIKSILNEIIYCGLFVVFGDISALFAVSTVLQFKTSYIFYVVVALTTFSIYAYNHLKEIDEDIESNPLRTEKIRKLNKLLPFLINVSILGSLLLTFFYSNIYATALLGAIYVWGITYTLFLKKQTKKILGFKNFMTAIPYSMYIPLMVLFHGQKISASMLIITLFYFLHLFINTVVFDFKDKKADEEAGLKTYIVILGKRSAVMILRVINILSGALIVFSILFHLLPITSSFLLLTIIYVELYLLASRRKNTEFFYNFFVDGEFIYWLFYVMLGKIIL